MLAAQIDLDHLSLIGQERTIGEVGAQHEQRVAVLHGPVAGGETEQAGHADIERVVVLDELLATQGVDDRGAQLIGQRDHLIVRTLGARTGQNRDLLGVVQQVGRVLQLVIRRHDFRRRGLDRGHGVVHRFGQCHIAGDHDHCHAALSQRCLHGRAQNPGHLDGVGSVLDVDRAFAEEFLRVGLLEVSGTDLRGGNVCGDRQHRDAGALRIEQAIDQVQVARTATADADRQLAGQGCLGARREGRRLLVTDMHPLDAGFAQRVGESVQRVAGNPVDPFDPAGSEGVDHVLGYCDHFFFPTTIEIDSHDDGDRPMGSVRIWGISFG